MNVQGKFHLAFNKVFPNIICTRGIRQVALLFNTCESRLA